MLAPDSIHEFIEAPVNSGVGTRFLLKLYWRLELAVWITYFLITPFCMGEAGRRSQELGPFCNYLYCNNHGGHGEHGDKKVKSHCFT
jgi:hypothetical protein